MVARIRDVWADNFKEEMTNVRAAIEQYPYVAMDTEFPGIVARPIGNFRGSTDYHYQTLRCNVDILHLIQLGITLSDDQGNFPPETSTWQFHFQFDINNDMCAPESLELLTKAGLDFDRLLHHGIDREYFGEMLVTSGLALFEDVKWITFHSGYDFGYLLKLVTCASLPAEESEFFEVLHQWFPCIYDIKYLMRSCKALKGGLQDVADDLQVSRVGPQHQAGSDSLLTSSTFFKLRDRFFDGVLEDEKLLGCLYGFANTSSAVLLPTGQIVYQPHAASTPRTQHAQPVVATPLTPGENSTMPSPLDSHTASAR
ncbi:CCR4-NOT core DEDD RNase subunit [Malassezia psittaci]|uniref:poly(A)-specific ribonuclease n=1 Tax=Malassezia psittaci TaxID=1821823 RepID=A0AAF0F936_9BASI|nr:CCR4-NOT core DEDD RNase subunit [Malassezia psittaci]